MSAGELPEDVAGMADWLNVESAFERYVDYRRKARALAEDVRETTKAAAAARSAYRIARVNEEQASEAYDRQRNAWHARQEESADAEEVES